jgi:soluble lytic murein transglycosylase-like protein
MRLLGFLVLLSTSSAAMAAEYAVLTTGSRLRADRHETEGGKVRLYTGEGYIEMQASSIQSFEPCLDAASAVAAAPSVEAPKAPKPLPTPVELADAAALKYGLPATLVRSVIAAESAHRPDAVSPKGAIGLMQLMPETAKDLGVNPHDPAENVDGGTRYLRDMLVRFDGRLWHALAAYNAGPGAVEKYGDIPPYRETIQYVKRIDRAYQKASQ